MVLKSISGHKFNLEKAQYGSISFGPVSLYVLLIDM